MKKPEPWYWEERNQWFCTVRGKRVFLGEHPKDARKPKKSPVSKKWNPPAVIEEAYRRVMGTEAPADGKAVANILDNFITWTYENRAKGTAEFYKDFCNDFVKTYGLLPVTQLTSQHVTDWLSTKSTWNSTTKNNAITAISRGFSWATKNFGLRYNPIAGMIKPKALTRKKIVTPDEFQKALETTKDQAFKDYLIVSFDSGARPQEMKHLEARHIQLDKCRAVIPAEESKKEIIRAIYFPEASMEVIKRLVVERPEGKLFLNLRGRPWTAIAVKLRFERMEKATGRRLRAYEMRKSFITKKIVAGVDSHVVAKLAGHTSTAMLDKHYSVIADEHEFLLTQARREISPKSDAGAVQPEGQG